MNKAFLYPLLAMLSGCASQIDVYYDPRAAGLPASEIGEISILAADPVAQAGAHALLREGEITEMLNVSSFGNNYDILKLTPGVYFLLLKCRGHNWTAQPKASLIVEKAARYELTCRMNEKGTAVYVDSRKVI